MSEWQEWVSEWQEWVSEWQEWVSENELMKKDKGLSLKLTHSLLVPTQHTHTPRTGKRLGDCKIYRELLCINNGGFG
jgi:hypothetical protein